jgi:hypothetical protein
MFNAYYWPFMYWRCIMIMRDYKNHKPASHLSFIDYLAAAGFILTIITLLFIATL